MHDQAQILRGLMEQRFEAVAAAPDAVRRAARSIAVTSGKGGVGKSNIALNLAVALQQSGRRVALLDANLGLGNLDLLSGLNGYWNLSHVLTGARALHEIVLSGPAGVHVIPGASGLQELADSPPAVQREILAQLEQLEANHDDLIIDTGAGIHHTVRQFLATDVILVVTTPEPTSIADAYATIKMLAGLPNAPEPHVLVNQADSPALAREIIARIQHTAHTFLHATVHSAGLIPRDGTVPQAVFQRQPFLLAYPQSPAARAMEQLARRLLNDATLTPRTRPFFARLHRPAA